MSGVISGNWQTLEALRVSECPFTVIRPGRVNDKLLPSILLDVFGKYLDHSVLTSAAGQIP